MSGNTAYEVQGYTGGVWRTLRVCDDQDDAVDEAKRARHNHKYLSVRVTVEVFNEASGKFFSRVVYRYSCLTPEQRAAVLQPRRSATSSIDIPRRPRYGQPAYDTPAVELAEFDTITEMLIWRLGLVALIGLSLLLAIHRFL